MKKEIIIILLIFLSVGVANLLGFRTSLKRQRDLRRILDIGKVESGLNKYYSEFGFYPEATDKGEILACPGELTAIKKNENGLMDLLPGYKKPRLTGLVACRWGVDSLWDATDVNYPAYISGLPADPQAEQNLNYVYLSDGQDFQILASLELKESEGYSREIVARKLSCGRRLCNFGRSGIVK